MNMPLACAIVTFAFCGLTSATVEADVSPVVQRAVEHYGADTRGVHALRQRSVYDQHAPGNNEHTDEEYSAVLSERVIVAVRWRHVSGASDDAHALEQRQAAADKQYAQSQVLHTRFALPIYPEAVNDYAFGVKSCAAPCESQAIDFTSDVHDDRHGHGTLTVDAGGRAVSMDFIPYVLPKPATSGLAHYDYGRHDGGDWGLIRLTEHYSGKMLMISGSADRVTTVSRHRKFASVDDAKRAVAVGDI